MGFYRIQKLISNLASDPATWSTTSVCLVFSDTPWQAMPILPRLSSNGFQMKALPYDIGSYRAAPAGLRIWCGATVESSDIAAMLPWLEWAYSQERKAFCLAVWFFVPEPNHFINTIIKEAMMASKVLISDKLSGKQFPFLKIAV